MYRASGIYRVRNDSYKWPPNSLRPNSRFFWNLYRMPEGYSNKDKISVWTKSWHRLSRVPADFITSDIGKLYLARFGIFLRYRKRNLLHLQLFNQTPLDPMSRLIAYFFTGSVWKTNRFVWTESWTMTGHQLSRDPADLIKRNIGKLDLARFGIFLKCRDKSDIDASRCWTSNAARGLNDVEIPIPSLDRSESSS